MSWIKDHQFAVVLGGVTLVGAAALLVAGLQGSSRYKAALADYQSASQNVATYERLPLYPQAANRDGKNKALKEYREELSDLQSSFDAYRPGEISNISPQEFADSLKTAHEEVARVFAEKGATLPDAFFLGFEGYTGSLAPSSSTGILNYELQAIKELVLALGEASPSALLNLYRQKLPEEEGQAWKPAGDEAARPLPLELSFRGTEESARKFLSSVSKSQNYYYVIRTLRISNQKKTAPLASEAKFEAAKEDSSSSGGFGGGFVLPGEEDEGGGAAPAAPADTSQILSQVLGKEEVEVFLRLDILQFLPAKELP